ncbi:hypothetical protein BDN67DRAFT_974944 [Paxillus ammoniavirescens]|nr:hypothetical protein BDN67DRAFT_974944 [Paxillus ammoniavirescens]
MACMDPREPTHWPQDPRAHQMATTRPNEHAKRPTSTPERRLTVPMAHEHIG